MSTHANISREPMTASRRETRTGERPPHPPRFPREVNPLKLRRLFLILLLLRLASLPFARGADEPTFASGLPEMDQESRDWLDSSGSTAFGKWLMQMLERQPDHPEWLAMFADILHGSELGPTDGWFPKASARSRFNWQYVLERYDRDGDGAIQRSEFPGSEADFDRLDRDASGTITESDLSWPEHALTKSPGSMLFRKADADSDGHVTREEWLALFDKVDSGQTGFLSLDDLRAALPNPPAETNSASADGPSKSILIRGLFHQEIGSLKPGPSLGESAPDFTLRTAEGNKEFRLAESVGSKPLVLIFGNITCGPFRSQAGNVEKLYRRYQDRANFLMVYVREAHPTDGWHSSSTNSSAINLEQPKSYEARADVARTCQRKLGFDMPFLVDTFDDAVGSAYSGMPSRLYVIDRAGKVAYKSGRGPFGFKPAEMEQSLIWLLTEDGAPTQAQNEPLMHANRH